MQVQIIGFLRLAQPGVAVKEPCRKHGISDAAFCGWRAKCGVGLGVGLRPHGCELIAAPCGKAAIARGWLDPGPVKVCLVRASMSPSERLV
jgi:putative transposase